MRGLFSSIGSQIRSRKKIILGGLAIALFFSLAPLQVVKANIFSDILGGITNIAGAIFFGPAILGITATLYFLALIASWLVGILTEVIRVIALSSLIIPVLPHSGIEVVTQGWEFTRDLTNLLFILILVFIGLATILRMQSYGLQKTLPLLIGVALFVNFSGVFVGFIVDMANLVTGFFVQKIQGLGFALDSTIQLAKALPQDILSAVTHFTDIGAILVPAIKALVFLIFYATFALILFIVMLLFIVRVGMLWLLTILAPLAFAAYILPATKKLTTQWFQQLIQWAIIGIPMSFFLWLAQIAATGTNIPNLFRVGVSIGGPDPGLADLIMNFTGPVVALLLLGAGVMLSMQFAPAASKGIINIGKSKEGRKFFRRALGGAGSFAWTRTLPKEIGGKSIGERTGDLGTFIRTKGENWQEKSRGPRPWTAWTKQLGSALEIGAGKINEQIMRGKRNDYEEAEKATLHTPSWDAINNMNFERQKPPVSQNREAMAGIFGGVIENTDSNDVYDAIWPKENQPKKFDWASMLKIFEATILLGPPFYRKTAKANIGRLLELARTPAAVAAKKTPESFVREIFERVTKEDVTKEVLPKQYINPYYTNPNDPHAPERAAWVIDNLVNATLAKPEVGPALLETKRDVRENVVRYLQTKDLAWFIDNHAEGMVRASRTSPGLLTLGAAPFLPNESEATIQQAVTTREDARERKIQNIITLLAAAGTSPVQARAQAEEDTRPPITIPTWM